MPGPTFSRGENRVGGSSQLLVINLGVAALIFALLELWRPLYFLTDDNLDCFYPIMTGMGRRMLNGQSPFISDYIFGGNYNLLRDPSSFFFHPIYLLAGLMGNSPARLFTIDFVALFFLTVTVAGFITLAGHLRRELGLEVSDTLLTLYTQSFTFSMIILCVGPSWVNYLGNHSAMPWLAFGILQTSWRRGLGLVTLFSIHHILAGHLEITVSASLFLTLFACGVAFCRRSWLPLMSWVGGSAIALVVLSPLIVPMVNGFLSTERAGGLTPEEMSDFAIPPLLFPASYFFSTFSPWLHIPYRFFNAEVHPYATGFLSCAAAWAIIPALASRRPWRPLEILCLGIVAVAALFIIRPLTLSEILVHIPVLRSLRWPFREIVEFQFFLHLFFVLRPLGGSIPFRWTCISIGILIFVAPLPFRFAPSFNPLRVDRFLLFSGAPDKYWAKIRALLGPNDVIVPIIPQGVMSNFSESIPFTLLGAGNYAILFQVRSGTGYTPTPPQDQLYIKEPISGYTGFFSANQEPAILAERPNVRFISFEPGKPYRIMLRSKRGPAIDLTEIPLQ